MTNKRRDSGFTLLEILVAVVVLAIMSFAAYGGLHALINARSATRARSQAFRHLQLAIVVLSRDVLQTVPRPIRRANGQEMPALMGGDQDIPPLQFTHAGRANPLGLPHSSLERVAYGVKNGNLIRYFWPVLDRSVATDPQQQILLHGVSKMDLQFLDVSGQWVNDWPPLNSMPGTYLEQPPLAVRITLITKRWGSIRRVLDIAP